MEKTKIKRKWHKELKPEELQMIEEKDEINTKIIDGLSLSTANEHGFESILGSND